MAFERERVDAYERFLNDDEACVLDLVKRRLGFDDGLDPRRRSLPP